MKPVCFFIVLLFFTACKKDNPTLVYEPVQYVQPDFAMVPTKDAKWYVHTLVDNNCFPDDPYYVRNVDMDLMKDRLWREDYWVEALDKDTIINNKLFHCYQVVRYSHASLDTTSDELSYRYYLYEDTATQKVYNSYGQLVVDFSNRANTGLVVPFPSWREVNITEADSLIVAGHYLKCWKMQNIYDATLEHFYKAIGIGGTSGILNFHPSPTSAFQVMSLDFIYKGDSMHFDFPLQ